MEDPRGARVVFPRLEEIGYDGACSFEAKHDPFLPIAVAAEATRMIPTCDPGPNPFGPPPVYIGGFGGHMVAVAGEVADGLITHPFTTRRSLLEQTLPAIDRGLARSGKTREQFDVIAATLVVTA